jgi:hypothetical protein
MDLYLVLGGELKDLAKTEFKNPDQLDIVGIFSDYEKAFEAWQTKARATIDNAMMRYFLIRFNPDQAL